MNGTASPEPPTRGEVKDESKEDLTSPSENVEICETSENVETRCVAKKSTGGKKRKRNEDATTEEGVPRKKEAANIGETANETAIKGHRCSRRP